MTNADELFAELDRLSAAWSMETDGDAERAACRAFVKAAPPGGSIPAASIEPARRNEDFVRDWRIGRSRSRIDVGNCLNHEDAREAIFVGQHFGYSDADIARYLQHNYDRAISRTFTQGCGEAERRGHVLYDDPPANMLSSMSRVTCKQCGRAVLGNNTTVYGSALEQDCKGAP